MPTNIVLRSVKGAALTYAEGDQNWESLARSVDAILADYTILTTDQNKILECAITSGTITLPTVADASGAQTDSFRFTIKNVDPTSLIVSGNSGETIEGFGSVILLRNESATFELQSASLEWNISSFYNQNLVGIQASSVEINQSIGVTSPIQTQLNNKQPLNAGLTDISAMPKANSDFIVGDGANFVAENGATARASMNVDVAGTDNSTDVTLTGTPNYITIAGQVINRGLIDLAADVTGVLPPGNIAGGGTYSKAFLSNGSFTPPFTGIYIVALAGGGGGGGGGGGDLYPGSGRGGKGGRNGNMRLLNMTLTGGVNYPVVLGGGGGGGAGGVQYANGVNGFSGGATTFNGTSSAGGLGGAGGNQANLDDSTFGEAGEDGLPYGNGGAGGASDANPGGLALNEASGGGGGAGSGVGTGGAGAAGSSGIVIISW